MENEFLHFVNLDSLQKEMSTDIQGIARIADVSPQTVYKWARDKKNGGCRPTYNALVMLLRKGASLNSLFGLEAVQQKKPINQEDFLDGVRRALAELAQSGKEPPKSV